MQDTTSPVFVRVIPTTPALRLSVLLNAVNPVTDLPDPLLFTRSAPVSFFVKALSRNRLWRRMF